MIQNRVRLSWRDVIWPWGRIGRLSRQVQQLYDYLDQAREQNMDSVLEVERLVNEKKESREQFTVCLDQLTDKLHDAKVERDQLRTTLRQVVNATGFFQVTKGEQAARIVGLVNRTKGLL